MRKQHKLVLGIIIGLIVWISVLTIQAQPERPAKEETLPQRIARSAKMSEENASRFLVALGPAIREEL